MMKGVSSFPLLSASVLLGTLLLLLSLFIQEGQGLKCHESLPGDSNSKEVDCLGDDFKDFKCKNSDDQKLCGRFEGLEGNTTGTVQSCACHAKKEDCKTVINGTRTDTRCFCSADLCNSGSCAARHPNCPTEDVTPRKNDTGKGNSGATTPTTALFTLSTVPALIIIPLLLLGPRLTPQQ